MSEFFSVEVEAGVATLTFRRPPVNAFSYGVYSELTEAITRIEQSDDISVVILAGAPESRAWIGGADLKDLQALDADTRRKRYALINQCLPRLYHLAKPVIAAINGHAVGVGVSVAALCDIRVASRAAFFARPEIDWGIVASGGVQVTRLNLPIGLVREMIYTGRRFSADELQPSGFFNYVVEPEEVLPKSKEIAAQICGKDRLALGANKLCNNAVEGMTWEEGYRLTQEVAARLLDANASLDSIRQFIEADRASK